MKELVLDAAKRTGTGKSHTRKMRAQDQIPGIVYGLDKSPEMVTVGGRELIKMIHTAGTENILLDIKIGRSKEKVLLKEIQFHPVTERMLHLDFQRIDMTKPIQVSVPLHFEGKSEGVKEGGVMEVLRRDVEVSCLPADIPSYISVNVEALTIGDSLHVSDIVVEKVEILTELDRTIVVVAPPTVVKVATAAEEGVEGEEGEAAEGAEGEAAEGEGESAEPEVITEKKKEE